jgi:hypothetical protein
MATAKYNWQEIKQKYLEGEIVEVTEFLQNFYRIKTKDYARQTKGWRDEKEQILKTQTENAKKELENDPTIKLKNQNILKAIDNVEIMVAQIIGNKGSFSIEDLPKVKIGWEILRVSQNLPTTYTKNDNNNLNTDLKTILKDLTEAEDVN